QEEQPYRASPCTDNKLRDRRTKSCKSIGTSQGVTFFPVHARLRRIGSPFAKSPRIREGREFHRRAFPIDRTCAVMAFRRDQSWLLWRELRPFTTAALLPACRDD